jgi:hypothetical protein
MQGKTGPVDSTGLVDSDLRFSARVDYFKTAEEAIAFAEARRHEGYNVNGGGSLDPGEPVEHGRFQGLYGVHWIDRQGEGWYG